MRVDRFAAGKAQQRRINTAARSHALLAEAMNFCWRGLRIIELLLQQRDIGRGDGQQIIEIMGDAGGQQGDGLDLLSLVELRLQGGMLGDCVARLRQRRLLALSTAQRDQIQQDKPSTAGTAISA